MLLAEKNDEVGAARYGGNDRSSHRINEEDQVAFIVHIGQETFISRSLLVQGSKGRNIIRNPG
jgi:hypothetical protein